MNITIVGRGNHWDSLAANDSLAVTETAGAGEL